MTNALHVAVHLGVVYLISAVAAAADAPNGMVRINAVVQKYEIAAMEDALDHGRFVSYDAVTLRIISPADRANQTIRVYFQFASVADDSPLRKIGQRCRFDFDKSRSKKNQLFGGALENLQWISRTGVAQSAVRLPKMRSIDPNVLAAIEKELVRLEANAQLEHGSDIPSPSRQVAYYLLAGLAAQGKSLKVIPEAELRLFDVERQGGRSANLMCVFANVRVALIDYGIQDKSGTYVLRTAVLYVRKDGKWVKDGSGATAKTDLPAR